MRCSFCDAKGVEFSFAVPADSLDAVAQGFTAVSRKTIGSTKRASAIRRFQLWSDNIRLSTKSGLGLRTVTRFARPDACREEPQGPAARTPRRSSVKQHEALETIRKSQVTALEQPDHPKATRSQRLLRSSHARARTFPPAKNPRRPVCIKDATVSATSAG
jgi:hypothetical protein